MYNAYYGSDRHIIPQLFLGEAVSCGFERQGVALRYLHLERNRNIIES